MSVKFGIQAEGDPAMELPGLTRVEIREQLGEPITYTVVFAEDVCRDDFQLLKHNAFAPCNALSIWVEIKHKQVFLVKGPVQGQQIKLVNGGQGSELQIKGSDNSIKMKQLERHENHKNEKDAAIVSEILKRNGFKEVNVIDKGLSNDESKHGRIQNQDDLSFITHLAEENGFYFWISYDEMGNEIANFNELPLKTPLPTKLIINSDAEKVNIDELSINWNADVPTSVNGTQLDAKKKTKVDMKVDGSKQHKLGAAPLWQITAKCKQEANSSHKPVDDAGRGQQRSEGALNEAEWFIKASCSTSFDRLCEVVHAHTVIIVDGAGSRHSGEYLVSGVTHSIDMSSYKMQIELMRNAWDRADNANGNPGTGI